jgi:rare lipoprotein A
MRPRFRLRRLRMAHLIIAGLMLAAPASALALSTTHTTTAAAVNHRHLATLPVRVSPRQIALGRSVLVDGRTGTAQAGATVELESARGTDSRWRPLGSTRIGRHGGWALHAHLRESADVRAVELTRRPRGVRGAQSAEAIAPSAIALRRTTAVSHVTAVQVQARLQVAARERAVLSGAETTVSGALLPARAGRVVALQARSGNGWRTLGHAHTGTRGRFAVRTVPPVGSARGLRVTFAGDHLNGGATGGAGTLTLYSPVVVSWYDDAGSTACGFHSGDGVASRTLACGTKVHFRNGGRSVTATVDDRGPYVYSREFDLNQNTAAALGFDGVGTVDASIG